MSVGTAGVVSVSVSVAVVVTLGVEDVVVVELVVSVSVLVTLPVGQRCSARELILLAPWLSIETSVELTPWSWDTSLRKFVKAAAATSQLS